jgi:hypothetical protein
MRDPVKYLYKSNAGTTPTLSFILLDWTVRESFHTLDYLHHQNVDRNLFEVIWIEFYKREPEEIKERIKKSEALGLPSPVDSWIVMEHDAEEYYHKHRMYNLGILESAGRITVILDSDAILRTDLVATILKEFKAERNLALHFEQIRNFDQSYHPFNYPSIDKIIGEGCVNATDGVPHGITTCAKSLKEDGTLWNIYNYGACFCANREDLIRIGGADEHEDYLGHVCGPYEMTARLINAGVQDKLNDSHFLYHAWHPNQGGTNNYSGPNNGRGMSTTAMKILKNGRVLPLKENGNIKELRLAQATSLLST